MSHSFQEQYTCVPPSAFAAGTGKAFTGAYAWNAPREAVGRERPLTRDEMRQVQGVLSTINRLPYFLRSLFTSRYDYIRRNKSPLPAPTPSEHAAAVLNLVDDGVIEWNDQEVVRALRGALKHDLRTPNRQQRSGSPLKPHEIAPSARLTRSERMQITRIRVDLAQNGIRPQRWELEALARGATVNYDGRSFSYPVICDWRAYEL